MTGDRYDHGSDNNLDGLCADHRSFIKNTTTKQYTHENRTVTYVIEIYNVCVSNYLKKHSNKEDTL